MGEVLHKQQPLAFGHSLRTIFPPISRPYLNQGSFGLVPLSVTAEESRLRSLVHDNPDAWFRRDLYIHVDQLRHKLSKFYPGLNYKQIVPVQNTTFMIFSVIHSWPWRRNDRLLITDIVYAPFRPGLEKASKQFGFEIVMVNLNLPSSNKDIVKSFQDKFDELGENHRVSLAMISVISSTPSIVLPVRQISTLLTTCQVPVLWDAAHYHGQIPPSILHPLDLLSDDDSYPGGVIITNVHKWGFAARTSAFAYISANLINTIHPILAASLVSLPGDAFAEFSWPGTMDWCGILAAAPALDFLEVIGGPKAVSHYCQQLAMDIGKLVSEKWGTEVLEIRDLNDINEHQGSFMTNVKLPQDVIDPCLLPMRIVDAGGSYVPTFALKERNKFGELVETYWARLSALVINDISDYVLYADMVLIDIKENKINQQAETR